MALNRQHIPYPAAFDYGPRSKYPTLAVVFHMAEGTDVAQYLSRNPKRGVSVQYTIEQKTARWQDGDIVRCLAEDRISGSLDPTQVRTTNDPYYGAHHAKYALGKWWKNPNTVVISVEVAGRAKKGPTKAQKASMVKLFKDIRERHPKVVPLGHRDFADYKACPGTTTRIKNAFRDMGGHGLDYERPVVLSRKDKRIAALEKRVADMRAEYYEVSPTREEIGALLKMLADARNAIEDAMDSPVFDRE